MNWNYHPERLVEWSDIAAAIRDTVTMDDAIHLYAPSTPTRNHRCPCPFHHGKDYNLSYTPQGFRCFVCGASGDVIGFVKDICGYASRVDAMKRINKDYGLHLPLDGDASAEMSAEIARKRAEHKARQLERERWWSEYNRLMDEWTMLDITRMTADPETDAYAYAVKRIDYIGYLIDSLPPEPR